MAHPNPVTVENEYSPTWTTARPNVEDDVQALAANQNALNEASQDVDARVTALATTVDEINTQPLGLRRGLRIIQSTTSPQTDFQITCDRFTLSDGTTVLEDVDVLIDIGDSGAGGLDTGTLAADTHYYPHIIHDSTGVMSPVTRGVISASAAPTLPPGYDMYGVATEIPVILTDSTPELVTFSHIPDQNIMRYYSLEDAGKTDSVSMTADDTWRTLDISALVPTGAPGAWCMFRYDGGDSTGTTKAFYIRPTWGATGAATGYKTLQRSLFSSSGAATLNYGPFWVPLDDNGQVLYRAEYEGTGMALIVWVVGLQFTL